ncbi:MAG TPA: hypothetical protein VHE83_14315 [Mycobacteriales bacterium]|nr:hypothetical protein [Mycobacteriales bacterium]
MTNLLTRSGRALVAGVAGATLLSLATGATAVAAPAHPQPSPAKKAPQQPERCKHPLPDVVLGNPQVKAHDPEGIYVFHDGDWQLRVTHPGSTKVVYAGVITASRTINLRTRHLEKRDKVAFSNHHKTVVFRFTNYGAIDGLSLNTHCAESVTFKLWINGKLAPVADIFEGKDRVTGETSNPFTVQRSDETVCRTGDLSSDVKGKPTTLAPGAAQGTYIYNTGVWHLRVTHPKNPATDPVVFSGIITSDRPMKLHRFHLERTDAVALSKDGKTLTYVFYNYGALDGLDIDTHCSPKVTFNTSVANAQESTSEIYLGAAGVHPATNPFDETRTVPAGT